MKRPSRNYIRNAFVFISAVLYVSIGFAQGLGETSDLFVGLKTCISSDLPEQMHALKIPNVDPSAHPGMQPPITDDIQSEQWFINDQPAVQLPPLEETLLYYDIFPNEEFVYLPPKSRILRSTRKESRFDWKYPNGMTFFHRIKVRKYKGKKEQIFEVRILKRIDGRWVFGVYAPSKSGPCKENLELRKAPVSSGFSIVTYRQSSAGQELKKIEYRAKRLDPRSCIDCHGMGDAEMLKVSTMKVGPCNFNFIKTLQKGINHPLFGRGN